MQNRCATQRGLHRSIFNGQLLLLGGLAFLIMSNLASGQVVSGSVVGSVTDASGGGIPGAMVKITLIQTNDSRSVMTNEAGVYTIATVTPGLYGVEIVKAG